MKSKETLLQEYLDKPYEVGDHVDIKGEGIKDKSSWGHSGNIEEVKSDGLVVKSNYTGKKKLYSFDQIRKSTDLIGHNPFKEKSYHLDIGRHPLSTLMYYLNKTRGGSTIKEEDYKFNDGTKIHSMNYDPFIILDDGSLFYYQRPFEWTLDQKQSLISSIVQGVSCGLVILREHRWNQLKMRWKKTNQTPYFYDIVDGKQRIKTIEEFVTNQFPSVDGFYYKDFSDVAQRKFQDSQSLSLGKMETNNEKDVLDQFLKVNHSGKPISKKHLNKVENVYEKIK